MDKILGRDVDMAEVEDRIEKNFRDVFEYMATTSDAKAETVRIY